MTLYDYLQALNPDTKIHVFLDFYTSDTVKYKIPYQKRFSLYKGYANTIRDNNSLKHLKVTKHETTKIDPITYILVDLLEKEEVFNIAEDNPRR